ncbi:MAG: DUF2304 domain-containing protein [Bacilli bacterium]|nr:DUF2304 domain-containing protein [Bacilli bacterium]
MNIWFIVLAIIFIIYIIHNIRKNDFSIKESFFWIMGCLVILVLSVFPKIIDFVAEKIGVDYPPSLLFVICILYLIYINFKLNKKIVSNEDKIIALAQEISILKGKK